MKASSREYLVEDAVKAICTLHYLRGAWESLYRGKCRFPLQDSLLLEGHGVYSPLNAFDTSILKEVCRAKTSTMEPKEYIAGLIMHAVNEVLEKYESEGYKGLASTLFHYSRYIPIDWLLDPDLVAKSLLSNRYQLFRYKDLIDRVIKPLAIKGLADYHTHFYATLTPRLSWLAGILPGIVGKVPVKGGSRGYRGDYMSPYDILHRVKLVASFSLARLIRMYMNSRVGDSVLCPLASFNKLRGHALGEWDILKYVYGFDTYAIDKIDSYESRALDNALRGRGVGAASSYLLMRLLNHVLLSRIQPYRGLEYFSQVYRVKNLPFAVGPGPRPEFVSAFSRVLSDNILSEVWIKVTAMSKANFVAVEKILTRLGQRSGKVRIQLTTIKKKSSCADRGGVILCQKVFDNLEIIAKNVETVLRSGSGGWVSYRKIYDMLAGFDVAGVEAGSFNWPYISGLYSLVEMYKIYKSSSPVISYHAGEEYETIISGLRRIYEVLAFAPMKPGDRLAHALALAMPTSRMGEYSYALNLLADYAFEYTLYTRGYVDPPKSGLPETLKTSMDSVSASILGRRIDPGTFWDAWGVLHKPLLSLLKSLATHDPTAWSMLQRVFREYSVLLTYSPSIEPDLDEDMANLLSNILLDRKTRRMLMKPLRNPSLPLIKERFTAIRNYILDRIRAMGVRIEVCPTSNAVIIWQPPTEHPLLAREYRDLVLLGTDDQAVLNTHVAIEYLHAEAARRPSIPPRP